MKFPPTSSEMPQVDDNNREVGQAYLTDNGQCTQCHNGSLQFLAGQRRALNQHAIRITKAFNLHNP